MYHYNHTSAGNVVTTSLRNSPFTSLVEMARIAGLGGGRVGSKRLRAASTKLREIRSLTTSVLSGLGSRSGSMRVETSYSVPTGEPLGHALLAAVADNFREVVGYNDHGWECMENSFFALTAEDVAVLAKAGVDRSLAAIQAGISEAGQTAKETLPIGLLPSIGELLLQLEGKVFRRVVVGRMLLEGLRRFGYVGEFANRLIVFGKG